MQRTGRSGPIGGSGAGLAADWLTLPRCCVFIPLYMQTRCVCRASVGHVTIKPPPSSSSSDRVDSRGPLRQPRVAMTTSLGPFSTNAEGCTVADLLDP